MTIESTLSKAVFLGNDTAVDFPFSFKVWEASQLAVIYTDPAGRDSPVSGFTVELNATGGVLHYMRNGQPLPTGHRLTIMRNMPFTQGIDLVSASRFDPQVMEDGMDQACAERQQLLEELDRAVKVPPSSDSTPEDLVHDIFDARNQAADSAANAAASESNAADSAAAAAGSAAHASAEADRATTQADRAQSLVEIGPATTKSLGFVQIGEGIAVTEEGVISVTPINLATRHTAGTVIVGEGLEISMPATPEQIPPNPAPEIPAVLSATEGGEGETPADSTNPPAEPPAEPDVPSRLGVISLGAHISEDSARYGKGDFQFYGHVKITDNFEEDSGAKDGVTISPKGVKTAWDRIMGIMNEQVITASGTWTVPETGLYNITCVGGGGSGGSGGYAASGKYMNRRGDHEGTPQNIHVYGFASGGGGGGGGAGETKTLAVTLIKGSQVAVTVGGVGGTSSFGGHLAARGGGYGNRGGSGGVSGVNSSDSWSDNGYFSALYGGGGGSGGTSHGSAAGAGGGGATYSSGVSFNSAINGGYGAGGGISTEGYYGNGGSGGSGEGISFRGQNDGRFFNSSTYGRSNGSSGRQGCIKIKLANRGA